ncbi:hypothetical protein [Rathayibacter toxicus]|uniref:DUF3558 domain-containing protein n=1 Tax=Rathayibacter toxicus TaxID=145458 RepID=A0A0C5BCF4_9MICO|nr:hypothetical protein [Rathayibacter toxicus]AJM76861.1 hypothetical protein TI83_00480 [Rathayibacter toxicus]ALS57376.1 hypothetical protein APU90_06000 [Rathayibacter toxicus]KKM45661.1 hypothetical protein VT73_05705 [Rathayibacter toxicus]PPG24746.1 hypothetical protein C5D15_00285 [Rathayibacter toxicus]PPG48200.1 hypothetical protein C5D16_00295 [Rathayibacter toxicus]
MRARAVSAAFALVVTLAGCTTPRPSEKDATSFDAPATPSPHAVARLTCDTLLSASRAATVLGVERSEIQDTPPTKARKSAEVMREVADEKGGLLQCGWYRKDGTATIIASAVANAAAAFAGQSGTRLATTTEAYGSCTNNTCGIDLLAGTTWVTLAIVDAPADLDLSALATDTAAGAVGSLDEATTVKKASCTYALTAEQLTTIAGLPHATLRTGKEGGHLASATAVADTRAGYTSCTWSDANNSTAPVLSIDALPDGDYAWRKLSLTSGLVVPLKPLDGVGARALAGCSAEACEIDTLADNVWWRIVVPGDAARAEAVARAVVNHGILDGS